MGITVSLWHPRRTQISLPFGGKKESEWDEMKTMLGLRFQGPVGCPPFLLDIFINTFKRASPHKEK